MKRFNSITSMLALAALLFYGQPMWAQQTTLAATAILSNFEYEIDSVAIPASNLRVEKIVYGRSGSINAVMNAPLDSIISGGVEASFDEQPGEFPVPVRWTNQLNGLGMGANAIALTKSAVYALSSNTSYGYGQLRTISSDFGMVGNTSYIFTDVANARMEVRVTNDGDVFFATTFSRDFWFGPLHITTAQQWGTSGLVVRLTRTGKLFFVQLTAGEYSSVTAEAINKNSKNGIYVGGTINGTVGYLLNANLVQPKVYSLGIFAGTDSVNVARLIGNVRSDRMVAIVNSKGSELATYFAGQQNVYLGAGGYIIGTNQSGELEFVDSVIGPEAQLAGGYMNSTGQMAVFGRAVQGNVNINTADQGGGSGGFHYPYDLAKQFYLALDVEGRHLKHGFLQYGKLNCGVLFDSTAGQTFPKFYAAGYRQGQNGDRDLSFSWVAGDSVLTYWIQNFGVSEEITSMNGAKDNTILGIKFNTRLSFNGTFYSSGLEQDGTLVVCLSNPTDQKVWKSTITAVDQRQNTTMPVTFYLEQNYPNPFNPSTKIAFQLPAGVKMAKLVVYNFAGQLVRDLPISVVAGFQSVIWDGTNQSGQRVVSGTYIYRLQAGAVSQTRKLQLLK